MQINDTRLHYIADRITESLRIDNSGVVNEYLANSDVAHAIESFLNGKRDRLLFTEIKSETDVCVCVYIID